MPSADFCPPFIPPFGGTSTRQVSKSPGYCACTFVPCARRIYVSLFRMTIGLWTFMPPRPETAASYAQRVPQAGTLLTPSFRPHLAMVALGVRLMVPVIRVHRGLSPPSACALPGAHKKREGVFPSLKAVFGQARAAYGTRPLLSRIS